jgi:hypothetical protein
MQEISGVKTRKLDHQKSVLTSVFPAAAALFGPYNVIKATPDE